VTKEQYK
jgi:translation initiation factor IF-3